MTEENKVVKLIHPRVTCFIWSSGYIEMVEQDGVEIATPQGAMPVLAGREKDVQRLLKENSGVSLDGYGAYITAVREAKTPKEAYTQLQLWLVACKLYCTQNKLKVECFINKASDKKLRRDTANTLLTSIT